MSVTTIFLIVASAFVTYGTPPDYRLCPVSCSCTTESAVCDSLDFPSFAREILRLKLKNVRKPIDINKEFLGTINVSHLQYMTFENVTIEHIDPSAFASMENLQNLIFLNSTLPKLAPESFVMATSLQLLEIDRCDLGEFRELKSESIQILKISNCKLTEINEDMLINLPELTDVNLADNMIEKIDPKAFLSSYYLSDLNLTNNKISELPTDIFKQTEDLAVLDLSGNPIKKINASDLVIIEKLVLRNCNLKEFNGGDFAEMGHLDLSNNQISELASNVFGNMPDLEYLDLSNNKLKTLPSNIFNNNTRLQKIILNKNGFEFLPKFSNKETMPTYYFSCNDCGLENIETDTFENMPVIITLNLSGNRLQKIDPKVLNTVRSLNTLDISYNIISNLALETFENNTRLSNLNLAGNNIASLNPGLFSKNQDLKSLDISNNALKNIWKPIAGRIPSLEILNLADNRLDVMTKEELELTPNLIVLNVNNNDFNCTEQLDDAIKWLNKKLVQPSSLGTHAELQDSDVSDRIYRDDFWRKLCDGDDIYDDEDIDDDVDEDENLDDEDDEEEDRETSNMNDHDDIDIDNDDSNDFYEDKEIYISSTILTRPERYSFVWPLLVFIFTALLVLLLVSNIILCILRRRGHLPRNINLTWKNGHSDFVYKPLTEELPRPGSIIITTGIEKNQTQNL